MAQNIKLIKLLNGQDIIAEVVEESEKHVRVKNPIAVVVIPSRTDPKTPSVGFAPWAEFSDEKEMNINTSHVLVMMKPIKEFLTQYTGMFGGLMMPTNKLILPT